MHNTMYTMLQIKHKTNELRTILDFLPLLNLSFSRSRRSESTPPSGPSPPRPPSTTSSPAPPTSSRCGPSARQATAPSAPAWRSPPRRRPQVGSHIINSVSMGMLATAAAAHLNWIFFFFFFTFCFTISLFFGLSTGKVTF